MLKAKAWSCVLWWGKNDVAEITVWVPNRRMARIEADARFQTDYPHKYHEYRLAVRPVKDAG